MNENNLIEKAQIRKIDELYNNNDSIKDNTSLMDSNADIMMNFAKKNNHNDSSSNG